MFNKSDYNLNKTDPEAIVCPSVTGELTRITRADFDSDEEFQMWKAWSDKNYHSSEKRDRTYNDRRRSLAAICHQKSVDNDSIFELLDLKAAQEDRERLMSVIESELTENQYRRLWQRFVCGRELADIAAEECVSLTAVNDSIRRAVSHLKMLRRAGKL